MATDAQTSIVNRALFQLGQEPVADLSEASLQQSLSATKLMRVIEDSRDTVLRRHGWLCALSYQTLSPAVIPAEVNWRYPAVFLLPGDALRVWEIGGVVFNGHESCWAPRWQMGSTETNAGSRQIIRSINPCGTLNVAYVRRCNWASLDAHVGDAVAFDLASRGAFSVTGDAGLQKKLETQAEAKALLAVSVDGTQEGGQPPLAPSIPAALRMLSR